MFKMDQDMTRADLIEWYERELTRVRNELAAAKVREVGELAARPAPPLLPGGTGEAQLPTPRRHRFTIDIGHVT